MCIASLEKLGIKETIQLLVLQHDCDQLIPRAADGFVELNFYHMGALTQ